VPFSAILDERLAVDRDGFGRAGIGRRGRRRGWRWPSQSPWRSTRRSRLSRCRRSGASRWRSLCSVTRRSSPVTVSKLLGASWVPLPVRWMFSPSQLLPAPHVDEGRFDFSFSMRRFRITPEPPSPLSSKLIVIVPGSCQRKSQSSMRDVVAGVVDLDAALVPADVAGGGLSVDSEVTAPYLAVVGGQAQRGHPRIDEVAVLDDDLAVALDVGSGTYRGDVPEVGEVRVTNGERARVVGARVDACRVGAVDGAVGHVDVDDLDLRVGGRADAPARLLLAALALDRDVLDADRPEEAQRVGRMTVSVLGRLNVTPSGEPTTSAQLDLSPPMPSPVYSYSPAGTWTSFPLTKCSSR